MAVNALSNAAEGVNDGVAFEWHAAKTGAMSTKAAVAAILDRFTAAGAPDTMAHRQRRL